MKTTYIKYLPFAIGFLIGISLFCAVGWWGFVVLFLWIGASISFGIALRQTLRQGKKDLGRRVSILLNLPALLNSQKTIDF